MLLSCVSEGAASDPISRMAANGSDNPTKVTASEEIVYDKTADSVEATGGVTIDRDALHLTADTVHFNASTQDATADGDVRMNMDGDNFSGNRLNFNLDNQTGAFYDGTLFLKDNNMHIKAGEIKKYGADSIFAQDVLITTCDGASPAWEIAGKKLDITVGGYGTMSNALFKVKRVPVFYFPFLVFPVNLPRQSGLLSPYFDYSQRRGLEYSQPFYWAINDSSDATFYLNHMALRGEKLGAEYRYFLSDTDKGVAMFDFLKDKKVDDGTGTTSKDWGYGGYPFRQNSDRYWFRMKQDQEFGDQSSLMLDLDIVSDQDYLHEFRRDVSGYQDSDNLFLGLFNRQLDDYNDQVRKNRLAFTTQWPGYSLNAEALWWDNVIARTQNETDSTVQSLPVVSFDGYRQPLFGTLLYGDFETQAAYLYRKDGIRGERIDLYPRLYLPRRLGRVLSVEPSVGARETLWQISDDDGSQQDTVSSQHRELYDFKLDLSSEIYHVFRPDWAQIDALKHNMRFQVDYDYTPTLGQEDYPYFDGLDRIDGENLITYSIVNTFTSRRGAENGYQYSQVARLELSQSYDLNKERNGDPEPFNPVEGYLQLDFGKWCYLEADAEWSTYSGEFASHNIAYRFSDERGDLLSLQHRYTASLLETLMVSATLKLTDGIWLFPKYEKNLKTYKMVSRGLDLIYRAQCWSVETRYEEEYDNDQVDWHVGLTFTLYGLGGMGSGALHNEGLPSWANGGF